MPRLGDLWFTYNSQKPPVVRSRKNIVHNMHYPTYRIPSRTTSRIWGTEISFRDKLKWNTTRTIGELGCESNGNALVLLYTLKMVRARRRISNGMVIVIIIVPGSGVFIPFMPPVRHWSLLGE